MLCKLCQQEQAVNSHVIPRFAAKWLKDTSVTGYLRRAVNPNLRVQDFPTEQLLCTTCEARFSAWEKQFAEAIFLPYHEKAVREFNYEEWLLLFAVSLSWRAGIIRLDRFGDDEAHLARYLENALSTWGNLLLGKPSSLSKEYAHHLLFLGFVVDIVGAELPEGFHWYALRGVDLDTPASSKEVFVYVKLPGMIFFSGVHPAEPAGWKGTRIFHRGKIVAANQEVTHGAFGKFFLERANQAMRLAGNISGKQEKKIEEAIKKDPARITESKSLQVYLIEEYWNKKRRQST